MQRKGTELEETLGKGKEKAKDHGSQLTSSPKPLRYQTSKEGCSEAGGIPQIILFISQNLKKFKDISAEEWPFGVFEICHLISIYVRTGTRVNQRH